MVLLALLGWSWHLKLCVLLCWWLYLLFFLLFWVLPMGWWSEVGWWVAGWPLGLGAL